MVVLRYRMEPVNTVTKNMIILPYSQKINPNILPCGGKKTFSELRDFEKAALKYTRRCRNPFVWSPDPQFFYFGLVL
jgi:hypothetical protein